MDKNMYWGYLIHLGFNFWQEAKDAPDPYGDMVLKSARSELLCDRRVWTETTDFLAERGGNLLVIDLGEGLRYESHPELAVTGSWTAEELRKELARLRAKGITPIPKMNFSTAHDEWLGEYSRMVSTPKYYEVCKDLLEEVIPVTTVRKKDSWRKCGIQIPKGEVKTAMVFDILPGKQRFSHSALTADIHHTGSAVSVKEPACCGLYFLFIFFDSLHFIHPVISRVDFISLYHSNSSFTTTQAAKSAKILMNTEQKFDYKTVQVYKLSNYF